MKRANTQLETKFGETQAGYKDLMKSLEAAMQKAVRFEQDKTTLLRELKRISKQVKKTKAFQIVQEELPLDESLAGNEAEECSDSSIEMQPPLPKKLAKEEETVRKRSSTDF